MCGVKMNEYIKLTVLASPEISDRAQAFLYARDIWEFQVEDRRDVESLDIPAEHWTRIDETLIGRMPEDVRMTTYLESGAETREKLEALRAELAGIGAAMETEDVVLPDFDAQWRDWHGVTRAGRFVICPPWESADLEDGKFVIEIDPGMAFGTGGHATTTLCLEFLSGFPAGNMRVADLGTGSGILAIACAKMGYDDITATDIDADCLREARRNAEANGVSSMHYRQGNLLGALDGLYDIVFANIIDDAILAILPDIGGFLREGARFVGSGIEAARWPEIADMLEREGFTEADMRGRDDWRAFSARWMGR